MEVEGTGLFVSRTPVPFNDGEKNYPPPGRTGVGRRQNQEFWDIENINWVPPEGRKFGPGQDGLFRP